MFSFERLCYVFISFMGAIFMSYLGGYYLFFLSLIILGAMFVISSSFFGYYNLISSFLPTSLKASGFGLSIFAYSSVFSLFFLKAKGFFFY